LELKLQAAGMPLAISQLKRAGIKCINSNQEKSACLPLDISIFTGLNLFL
jgi:hypothetical protein